MPGQFKPQHCFAGAGTTTTDRALAAADLLNKPDLLLLRAGSLFVRYNRIWKAVRCSRRGKIRAQQCAEFFQLSGTGQRSAGGFAAPVADQSRQPLLELFEIPRIGEHFLLPFGAGRQFARIGGNDAIAQNKRLEDGGRQFQAQAVERTFRLPERGFLQPGGFTETVFRFPDAVAARKAAALDFKHKQAFRTAYDKIHFAKALVFMPGEVQ
ncbi:MAG: hypothetical protein RBR77_14815 [Thauera sp.]|nr:hypothetical protein [Thauera sp.]